MIGGKMALLTNKEIACSARCYLEDLTWQLIYWYLLIAKVGEFNELSLFCTQNKSTDSRRDIRHGGLHTSSRGRGLRKEVSTATDHTVQTSQHGHWWWWRICSGTEQWAPLVLQSDTMSPRQEGQVNNDNIKRKCMSLGWWSAYVCGVTPMNIANEPAPLQC